VPQPTGATEKTGQVAIPYNGEVHRRDTVRYPRAPYLSEPSTSQQIQYKLLLDMIVGVLKIHLAKHPWNTRIDPTIHTFIRYKYIIQDLPTFNKGILGASK